MSKRYEGRKKTIEAYKKERERVMKVIKRLEQRGVQVSESVIPKQGGKVTYKDVQKLKSLDRESIARKSVYVTKEYNPKTGRYKKVTVSGKDVLYEVEKTKNRERTERYKEIKRIAEELKNKINEAQPTKEAIERQEDEERKTRETQQDELEIWLNKAKDKGVQVIEDEDQPYLHDGSANDPNYGKWRDTVSAILDAHLNLIDKLAMDPMLDWSQYREKVREVGSNAWDASQIIREAIEATSESAVARALLELEKEGFKIEFGTFYEENYKKFTNAFYEHLDIEDRKIKMLEENERNETMDNMEE